MTKETAIRYSLIPLVLSIAILAAAFEAIGDVLTTCGGFLYEIIDAANDELNHAFGRGR